MTPFWSNAIANAIGSFVGGSVLATLALLFSDFVFALPRLSGFWTLETTTLESARNPYKGLKVTFLVALWQEGVKLHGTGEKVFERRPDGSTHEYIGDKRTRLTFEGYIRRKYFGRSEIVLHVVENAHLRDTSTVYQLKKFQRRLTGTFESTAANSSGRASWRAGVENYAFNWSELA